ncbi:MAG: phage major capsid protein [Patescibacteria group bacterium]|nr:phage major capsid protein [Patescibacteria group bacterium]
MATTEQEILAYLKEERASKQQIIKRLEDMANRPAAGAGNGRNYLMGHNSPYDGQGKMVDPGWPLEKLQRLKVYDQAAVSTIINHRKGRSLPLLGWGPMLMEIGANCGIQQYKDAARSQLGWRGGSDEENDKQLYNRYVKSHGHGPYRASKANMEGKAPWEEKSSGFWTVEKAALAESSGQTGGYTLPPQFQSELLTIQAEEAFFKQRCRVQPMNALTVQWPTLDVTTNQGTGVSPYFGGIQMTWQPEAALINESEPAFRLTDWTANTMVLYAVSSNQLLADNGIGLDALMTMLFGEAAAWFEEYAYLRGTGAGSSMPLGVLNSPCAILQTRNTANSFFLTDAAGMLSHSQIRGWNNQIWMMHQSVIPQMIQMVGGGTVGTASTTNIPGNLLVWMNQFESGAAKKLPDAFLNNRPLFFTEKLPQLGTTGDVMLVDPSHYIIGQRLDVQIDISPHYLFRNNQLAWRVIFRSDGKFWLNGAITDAEGWSVSPAVVLK